MEKPHFSELLLQKLHQKEFLNDKDLEEIADYQKKGIFSLRSELLLMIYSPSLTIRGLARGARPLPY